MISITSTGSFQKTMRFLEHIKSPRIFSSLERHGRIGVEALSRATPLETGETANSWGYQVSSKRGSYSISWFNTNREDGVNIAVIIQYGHGTGTGGYVQGRDYINPTMRPIFDKIAEEVWREVTNGQC